MSAELQAYLRVEAGRRFELGTADCCCLAADWVRLCRGVDPIADCRGYAGDANARLVERGGLLRAAGRGVRVTGVPGAAGIDDRQHGGVRHALRDPGDSTPC